MISNAAIISNLPAVFAFVVTVLMLNACDVDGGDNMPRISDQGLFMLADANHHQAEDTAQVAAAVYNDGEPINLVGGDVFEARTATERVILKHGGPVAGSYAASLQIDDSVQDVFLKVVHAPLEAREDRWYPIDILVTDPGPGELVGKSATLSFPPAVTISGPPSGTVFSSINDVLQISWVPVNEGDIMRVLAAVDCTDGLATTSYGVVVDNEVQLDMGLDDGFEALSLDKFIYDLDTGSDTIKFVADAALALLQELLNQLSAGNIDPDFLLKIRGANPIESTCEIRLFLQRQRPGQFDVAFDGGSVTGSSSAETTVIYMPSQATN